MKKIMDHNAYPESLKNKSVEELEFIRRDSYYAIMANPDGVNSGYYADEICYCSDELKRRNKIK
jgi:hypothetical protein